MHIGCCENCKYLDLIEGETGECPRCGGQLESLGIPSDEWNRMGASARKSVIDAKFPPPEPEPEPERTVEEQADFVAELFKTPVEVKEEEPEIPAYRQPPVIPEPEEKEYVYVCYKCTTIAAHDDERGTYYCPDCGSDMIPTGITTFRWSDLSKEEKRRAAEDAKIAHMVTAIKDSTFDDSEGEVTQSIINVVANKDKKSYI